MRSRKLTDCDIWRTARLSLRLTVAMLWFCQTATADTKLPTAEEFNSALSTCATGSDIDISADLLGSITSIYNGQRSNGAASFKTSTKFLELFPETDRAKVYELYAKCVSQILRRVSGDIDQLAGKNERLPRVVVTSTAPVAESDVLSDHNFLVYPQDQNKIKSIARVDVSAYYSDSAYNSVRYLAGLTNLSFAQANYGNVSDSVYDVGATADEYNYVTTAKKKPLDERVAGLHWRVYIKSHGQPDLSDLILGLGPFRLSTNIDRLAWQPIAAMFGPSGNVDPSYGRDEKSSWYAATAKISVELPEPSWVMIYSAQLLNAARSGSILDSYVPESRSVLEIVIQNLMHSTYPLGGIKLAGWAPWLGTRCFPPSGAWHQVTLNWKAVVRAGNDAPLGPISSIDGRELVVPARFMKGNCAADYNFEASIPIDLNIGAREIERIYLEIKEIPSFDDNYYGEIAEGGIKSVLNSGVFSFGELGGIVGIISPLYRGALVKTLDIVSSSNKFRAWSKGLPISISDFKLIHVGLLPSGPVFPDTVEISP
jgi:hypothetical protein